MWLQECMTSWLPDWDRKELTLVVKHSFGDDVPNNISIHPAYPLIYSFHYIISKYCVLSSNGAFCFCDFLLLGGRLCEAQTAASCIPVTRGPSMLLGRIQQCFFTKLSLDKLSHPLGVWFRELIFFPAPDIVMTLQMLMLQIVTSSLASAFMYQLWWSCSVVWETPVQ